MSSSSSSSAYSSAYSSAASSPSNSPPRRSTRLAAAAAAAATSPAAPPPCTPAGADAAAASTSPTTTTSSPLLSREESLLDYRFHAQKIAKTNDKFIHRTNFSTPQTLWQRQAQGGPPGDRQALIRTVGATHFPRTIGGSVDCYNSALFSARFDRSGENLFTACQDGSISLYSVEQLLYHTRTDNPARPSPDSDCASSSVPLPWQRHRHHSHTHTQAQPSLLRPKKKMSCQDVGWSIVGSAFSPDSRWIAYSSWSRYLHLTNTFGQHELHESVLVQYSQNRHFCLFSLAFSADGTRVIGGGNDGNIHIVQLERKHVNRIEDAHADDVNTVCYVDEEGASNLILSGSDDGLIKLFDLRTQTGTAQGLLAGHGGGVTNVCSKGDGRFILSNSKDQTAKLWDLRRMGEASPENTERMAVAADWDYRFDISESPFGGGRRRPTHTRTDHSLMTFRGHRVARTLIQAVFSPLELTGGRYVVCGSAGGKVYVYDTLTGSTVGDTDRHTHTYAQGGGGSEEVKPSEVLSFHVDCTRTVAFAPSVDLMVSAGWDGRLGLWRSC